MKIRNCGSCALWQHNNEVCPYFQQEFPKDEGGCPMFVSEICTCDICGKITVNPIIDVTDENHLHYICESCSSKSGTCATCKCGGDCLFQSDPSSLPKFIKKEIRQGNMIAVTDIPNPERIRQTCQKGCPCFDPEFGCLKQNNTCGKWRIVYEEV